MTGGKSHAPSHSRSAACPSEEMIQRAIDAGPYYKVETLQQIVRRVSPPTAHWLIPERPRAGPSGVGLSGARNGAGQSPDYR